MRNDKLTESIYSLKEALTYRGKALKEKIFYAGIAKSFEVCLEYSWKAMKLRAQKEGLEVYSPREAIKAGARLGLITNLELWLDFLENRNIAVHDYLGISQKEYLTSIDKFVVEVDKLLESDM